MNAFLFLFFAPLWNKEHQPGTDLPLKTKKDSLDLFEQTSQFVDDPSYVRKKSVLTSFYSFTSQGTSSNLKRFFIMSSGTAVNTAIRAAVHLRSSKIPTEIAKSSAALFSAYGGAKPTLPDLKYDYGALAPAISAETMTIHHTKHHQAVSVVL